MTRFCSYLMDAIRRGFETTLKADNIAEILKRTATLMQR
jgi:hypothetical protein